MVVVGTDDVVDEVDDELTEELPHAESPNAPTINELASSERIAFFSIERLYLRHLSTLASVPLATSSNGALERVSRKA